MIEIIPNWHPIFVHFTVALMSVAVLAFLVAHLAHGWRYRDEALKVAEWNFWLGSLSALVTLLAGWDAYNTVAHDAPSHAAMTTHRNWALVTLGVILVLDVWLWRIRRSHTTRLSHPFSLALVVFIGLLGVTAWHGGELVYRYGLGVMSLPVAEGDGHAHEHGEGQAHGHVGSNAQIPADSSDGMPATGHHDAMHEPAEQQGGGHGHEDGHGHDAAHEDTPAQASLPPNAVEESRPAGGHHHDDGHSHEH